MKYLIVLFVSLTFFSCKEPPSAIPVCELIDGVYQGVISYQDVQSHRFHTDSVHFYTGSFSGSVGKTYQICVEGLDVTFIK